MQKIFRNINVDSNYKVAQFLNYQAREYCVIDDLAGILNCNEKHKVLMQCKGFDNDNPEWIEFESLKNVLSFYSSFRGRYILREENNWNVQYVVYATNNSKEAEYGKFLGLALIFYQL